LNSSWEFMSFRNSYPIKYALWGYPYSR
jgi:hypothetical protein